MDSLPEAQLLQDQIPEPDLSPFIDWANQAAKGDEALAKILLGCVARFRRRHSSVFIPNPGPGIKAIARIWRGIVMITDDGLVRSSELFRIANMDGFYANPATRVSEILATNWDDRAALFARRLPPRRTREAAPLIDWEGDACLRHLPDQVRNFEYLVNTDLHGRKEADTILETVKPLMTDRTPDIPSHRPLKASVRESFLEVLKPLVTVETAAALDKLRDALDFSKMKAIAAAGANSVSAYNWLAGIDRKTCDPELGKRRTQAVTAFPIIWKKLSRPTGTLPEAVADGRPLIPLVAAEFGVSERVVRRMNGLNIEGAGIFDPNDEEAVKRAIEYVARMPEKGAAPKSTDGWKAFFASVRLANAIDSHNAVAPDGKRRLGAALLAESAGRWDGLDYHAIGQAASGLSDMVNDFFANVGAPLAELAENRYFTHITALERIAGGRNMMQMAQASHWWHENQAAIRTILAERYPAVGVVKGVRAWPSLHGDGYWRANNGLMVVPLTDEDMLVDEHKRLGHCINQYAPNALYGGSHLLSVRTPDGRSLATVEIAQKTILPLVKSVSEPPDAPIMSKPPSVIQFYGKENSMPRIEAWEALWDYVSAIMTGRLEIDKKYLEEEFDKRVRHGHGRLKTAAAYDTSNPEGVMEAWKLYTPLLPKSVAKRGPFAMVEMTVRNDAAAIPEAEDMSMDQRPEPRP